MEVSLTGVAHTDSFEASAWDVEKYFTLDQAPEKDALQVASEVIFTTIATTKNTRKGNFIIVESTAGSP